MYQLIIYMNNALKHEFDMNLETSVMFLPIYIDAYVETCVTLYVTRCVCDFYIEGFKIYLSKKCEII